jgi:hypothetical protein
MERVLLKEHNYPEWEEYIRDELLARALWGIVQGTTQPPRKPTVPKGTKSNTTETETAAAPVDSETPESTDSVYMSDFRRYLIQRDTYNDKVGMATAEIRRSLDPSVRRRYADKKYISAPDVLWTDIEKDFNRVAKIDANVGLYKLNAIRRADFDSAAAYHSRILEIATELRNVGTELPEKVLAFYMVQGLPTGDVWLAFRTSLNSSDSAGSCQKILDQLQIFERSYAWDRHGVSAYTNTELSTALFAKKGTAKKGGETAGGSGKASGGDQDKDSKTIKCFGCGKKGHKKFECRSKHLWKENSDSQDKDKEKKESSTAKVVKDAPASTTTDQSMDFLLLSQEPLTLRPEADKIRESVSTDRCATTTDWVVDSVQTAYLAAPGPKNYEDAEKQQPGYPQVQVTLNPITGDDDHGRYDDVHDAAADLQDDTPVAKIDEKDEALLQQLDEPENADLVKETPDDAHHDQIDINTTGAADEDSGTPIDKVRVGIGTTDDGQLQKQCRHSMVIDRYRQNLTYGDEAIERQHWRVQGRIGVG